MLRKQMVPTDTLSGGKPLSSSEETVSEPASPAEEMPRRSFFKRLALAGMTAGVALLVAACGDSRPHGNDGGGDDSGGNDSGGDDSGGDNSGGDDSGSDDSGGDDSGGDDSGGDDGDDILKIIHW